MPPSRGCDCGRTQPPRGTAHAGERGNVGARESKVPGRGPVLRVRSCSSSGGGKFLRPGGREWSQLAPGGRIRPTGGPRGNQFSQRRLSGSGSDGLRFSHLQLIIKTGFGRENFGAGIEAFWIRIIDGPNAFPPEFWQRFWQSNPTAVVDKCRPVCVGTTWRRLIAAGTMLQWRPRLEINREARQFGVGVRGGVEQVAIHVRVHHEAKKLADPHRLLQRIQHGEVDCYARGGSHLRAGACTVRGKMLR